MDVETLPNLVGISLFEKFFKWANPGLFYRLFLVFSSKHQYNFYNKHMWKNVNSVYGAGIQTHDLRNMSLLP